MSFHNSRHVNSRKPRACEQCGRSIDAGVEHVYSAGVYDGDFYTYRVHVECDAAADEYAKIHGLYGEESPWFQNDDTESEPDARKWMKENHPIVYERLGWAAIDKRHEDDKDPTDDR